MKIHHTVKNTAIALCTLSCASPTSAPLVTAPETADTASTEAATYPSLLVTADQRDAILARLDGEREQVILARIIERAERAVVEPDSQHWDHDAIGTNAETAQSAAFLAWLDGDAEMGAKAVEILLSMPTDFESNNTWDVNIRMPSPLICGVNALDLLRGTEFITETEVADAAARLSTVSRLFYERYVLDDAYRNIALGPSQNNHPIRTAAAIGYVALAWPEGAAEQLDWAISELDYLWSERGQYVQPDGGVSEGPFYYGFAYGPALALFIALENASDPDRLYVRDCINRQDVDPWTDHGCVDGEEFRFDNPLHEPLFAATVDWSIALRLPSGYRPPLADAYFNPLNGGAVLSHWTGSAHQVWDWEQHATGDEGELPMTHGMDLLPQHLVYATEEGAEPDWRHAFLPDAGNAVLRSGWDRDARWLLLVAESGSARKTLHDHVDGTSFSMAAYGEYLLVDPGYYKPNSLDNAVTADADSHNVILIDGQGAPDKGLLTLWGDADATLTHGADLAAGVALAYAEATQTYEETQIQRSAIFVRDRYFVIADRLATAATEARTHTWRVGGWAGYDAGGTFDVWDCTDAGPCGVNVERDAGGVDVYLGATADGLRTVEPEYAALGVPHVECFDRSRTVADHGVMDGEISAVDPGFLAVLAPYATKPDAASARLTVEALDVGEGVTGWTVTTADGVDHVLLREARADTSLDVAGHSVETDAEIVVFAEDGAFALAVGGATLTVDGVSLDPIVPAAFSGG